MEKQTTRNSSTINQVPVVYIAGKIQQKLRRYDLVNFTLTHSQQRRPKKAPLRQFGFNQQKYIYSGPYIVACHHLCDKDVCRQDKIYFPDIKIQRSESVFLRSLQGIQKADYVIVWLEDNDSYGTITELGYAFSLKKKIYIAYSPKITSPQDYWFVFSTAQYHRLCENRQKGLIWLFAQITNDLKKQVEIVKPKETQANQNQDIKIQSKAIQTQEKQAVITQVKVVQAQKTEDKNGWPNKLQYMCFGCFDNDQCQWKKKKIVHCWGCGAKDVYRKSCSICPQKKTKLN